MKIDFDGRETSSGWRYREAVGAAVRGGKDENVVLETDFDQDILCGSTLAAIEITRSGGVRTLGCDDIKWFWNVPSGSGVTRMKRRSYLSPLGSTVTKGTDIGRRDLIG